MSDIPLRRCGRAALCVNPEAVDGLLPETREYFYAHAQGRNGLHPNCKRCVLALNKTLKEGKRESLRGKAQVITDGQKPCSKCGVLKPLTEFSESRHTRTGLQSWCKLCCQSGIERYRIENATTLKVQRRLMYQANSADVKAYARAYYWSHRDRVLEYKSEYRRNHRTHIKLLRRLRWQRIREQVSAVIREERLANPLKFQRREWRRRERIATLPYDFTRSDWSYCLNWWGNACAVCGRTASSHHRIVADHWIPLASLQEDNPGSVPTNILPLCHAIKGGVGGCNNTKSARLPLDFLSGMYPNEIVLQLMDKVAAYFSSVRQPTLL